MFKHMVSIVAIVFTTAATPPATAAENLRISVTNGWKAFEVITVGDNPSGSYAMPGTFDGIGAQIVGSELRVQINHELSDVGTISEVNLNLANFKTSVDNMVTSGSTGGGSFVNSAQQAYDRWSDDGGSSWINTTDTSNTSFDRFCSGQSYNANTFGANRGFVDSMYITGEEFGSTGNDRLFAIDLATRDMYQLSGVSGSAAGGIGGMPFDSWENAALLDTGETNHVALLLSPDGGTSTMQIYIGEKGKDKNGLASTSFLARNGLAYGSHYYLFDSLPTIGSPSSNGTFDTTLTTGSLTSSKFEDVDTSPADPTKAVLGNQNSGLFTFDFNLDFSGGSFAAVTSGFSITKLQNDNADGINSFNNPDNVDWTDATTLNGTTYADGLIFVNEDSGEGEIWMMEPDGTGLLKIGQTLDNAESTGIVDISDLVGYNAGSVLLSNNQGSNSSLSVLINPNATEYPNSAPFTIAVIGDQQRPVDDLSIYTSFTVQTDWIAANAQANSIRFVTQVGDIVEHGNDLAEFTLAEAAMATLDTATNADGGTGIAWNVAYGNHEEDSSQAGADPAGAWAHNYRTYFGSASGTHRYAGQPEYKGVSTNDLNTWHIIRSSAAGGAREYLMLNLEYDTPGHAVGSTPDPADVPAFDAIAWAQGIIDTYPGMPTVITTHVFEGTAHGPPNNPYTGGPGRNSQLEIFDKLVKDNSQVFMVFSGHTSQATHQVKTNTAGLKVLQMVTDYNKVLPNGGDGFFRLVELDEDAGEIRVKTYTPGVPQNPTPRFDTSANGEFTIALDWSTRFGSPPSGPIMGLSSSSAATDDGATLQCQLGDGDATSVTLVWAFDDQGETTVGTWSAASGGGSHAFGAAVTNDVLSHVLSGLAGDTNYHFRFFATDGVDSDWSNTASFVTGLGGLAAPSNFTGLPGIISGGTKVDLSWTDGYANETGFLIRRSTDVGFVTFDEFPVGADETSYADETTDPNTTYYYRIAAVGSSGNGAFTGNLQVATGDAGAGPVAGLIAHWKFDDGSGAAAADSSASGYDLGQVNGDGSWITGKAGGAYSQARFTADATESDTLNLPGGSVTVSVWVTAHNTAQYAGIAGLEGTGNTGDIYGFKMGNDDKINWTAVGASPQISPDTLTTYAAATGDGWVHLVGTYDGATGVSTAYVNGAQVMSTTQAAGIPDKTTPSLFRIGTYWNSNSYEFNGAIDDVQVYDEALSVADVTFLYSNPGSALSPPAPTFADWITSFGLDPADQGFGDDPDGDGNLNGLENFLGTDPSGADAAGLSAVAVSGGGSNTFVLTHPENATPADDVSAFYEWSTDLSAFHADGDSNGAGSAVNFTLQPDTPAVGTTTVTATITGTLPDQLFVRLGVELNP